MKTNPKIYGIKSNKKLIYIGKTHCANKQGVTKKSNIQTIYANEKVRQHIVNKEIDVVELQQSDIKSWYKDRNKQAHKRFMAGAKHLLNDPWILEGKNGYWEGKERDPHTLKCLSESKYKRVAQYNEKGKLIKVWDSIKEPAIKIFKDYKVVNGSASSKIYALINNKTKFKFSLGSYWFSEQELISRYNCIPKNLHIKLMIEYERKERMKNHKYVKPTTMKRSTIIESDSNGKILNKYIDVFEASKKIGKAIATIRHACKENRKLKSLGTYWSYGERISHKI